MELVENASIPVVATPWGLGLFLQTILFLGMVGMHGVSWANKAITESDLIIALARFSNRSTGKVEGFAPKATIIHIDIDPAEIGKNIQAHIPIVGDVKQVLGEIIKQIEQKPSKWASMLPT